jgi:hypothetical protein
MFRCPLPSFDNETGETNFLVLNSGRPDYSPPSSPHKTPAIGGDRPRDERMHIDMTLFTAVTTVSVKLHVRVAAFFCCAEPQLTHCASFLISKAFVIFRTFLMRVKAVMTKWQLTKMMSTRLLSALLTGNDNNSSLKNYLHDLEDCRPQLHELNLRY